LRQRDSVHISNLARLADFNVWAVAGGEGLLWGLGEFETALSDNRENVTSLEVEASPFVRAAVALVADKPDWLGTAETLSKALEHYVDEDTRRSYAWPKGALKTGNALNRAEDTLGRLGITVQRYREAGTGNRMIHLTRALTVDDKVKAVWDGRWHIPLQRQLDEDDAAWLARNVEAREERDEQDRQAFQPGKPSERQRRWLRGRGFTDDAIDAMPYERWKRILDTQERAGGEEDDDPLGALPF
jgi:hypothetical protein